MRGIGIWLLPLLMPVIEVAGFAMGVMETPVVSLRTLTQRPVVMRWRCTELV